jgi:hypothetical protein
LSCRDDQGHQEVAATADDLAPQMIFAKCINRWLADIDLQLHVGKQFGIEIKGHGWTISESEPQLEGDSPE